MTTDTPGVARMYWMHTPVDGPDLPDTIALERRVLGWMLQSASARALTLVTIRTDGSFVFTDPVHVATYRLMVAFNSVEDPVNVETVGEVLGGTHLFAGNRDRARAVLREMVTATRGEPFDKREVRVLIADALLRRLLTARVAALLARKAPGGVRGDDYADLVVELLNDAIGRGRQPAVPTEVREAAIVAVQAAEFRIALG